MKKSLSPRPLSGDQYELKFSDSKAREHYAVISSIAGALRVYQVDGKNVVVPFGESELPRHFAGTVLLPFPNRLGDGKYSFEGKDYQAAINEVDRNNQLHSFSQFYDFDLVESGDDFVTLGLRLPAQKAYPFETYTEITYRLNEDGLIIDSETQNLSDKNAPFALGWHPWFDTRGDQRKAQISLGANSYVTVDSRLLPTGEAKVDGTDFDIRTLASMETLEFDDAWVDVELVDGYSKAELIGADGHKVTVLADQNYKAWQICSAAGFTDPNENRFGLAIEPMTAYADAFKTGKNLTILKPFGTEGDSLSTNWRIVFE
jgi:aldose 1-epimerase